MSAPWVLRSEQATSPDLDSSTEYRGRTNRPPPPGVEGLDSLMGSEKSKSFYRDFESSLPWHELRQAVSVTGGMTTTDGMTAAEQISSLKARQTIQAHDHLDGDQLMHIPFETVVLHDAQNSNIFRDNAARPALNMTRGAPDESGPNGSRLLSGQRDNSFSPVTDTPPLMTDSPMSFSAKPLPSDWTTITACTVLRSTTAPPRDRCSSKHNKSHNKSTSTTATAAVEGCVTTVLAIHPHPCRNPKTVYTSTKTVQKSINCHGCTSLQVLSPMYGCPLITANLCEKTTTAKTPYVWTSTVCARLTALSQLTDTEISRLPKETAACTETSRHMGTTTLNIAQPTTPTGKITTTPLVWPTSMEGLPWFGVSKWHS